MAELATIYGGSKAVPDATWVKSQNCVVRRLQDSLWYRAVILDINNDDKMVKVLAAIGYLGYFFHLHLNVFGTDVCALYVGLYVIIAQFLCCDVFTWFKLTTYLSTCAYIHTYIFACL